eukprot:TRINITY_DN3554_c0_g1_i1.p1 TRINITY_DN3554_c0_g1~~TRINITY_DN3554_c0_g1_i1.p1  ORF type:complete len:126 (+),score=11.00 TRINITY_DN3554_c0_g1_i1:227-604(+)
MSNGSSMMGKLSSEDAENPRSLKYLISEQCEFKLFNHNNIGCSVPTGGVRTSGTNFGFSIFHNTGSERTWSSWREVAQGKVEASESGGRMGLLRCLSDDRMASKAASRTLSGIAIPAFSSIRYLL